MTKAKPFLKWAGGKGQLLNQLDSFLPQQLDDRPFTYIEPFVGGGAMLFYMLQMFPEIKKVVINDINPYLVTAYRTIKDNAKELIERLAELEHQYFEQECEEAKKEFFLNARKVFNEDTLDEIDRTKYLIFLNRTCFNGLYRVNAKGKFNVPFGRYLNPTICNKEIILADSEVLNKVDMTILNGDFEQTFEYIGAGLNFFYFDPPYRPLSDTSSFNDYAKEAFNDDAQIRLKKYCDRINEAGFHFMLSNSDCKGKNEKDNFFDVLYGAYHIERVWASRNINSNPSKRGKLTEILVHNYAETKVHPRVKYVAPELDTMYAVEGAVDYIVN